MAGAIAARLIARPPSQVLGIVGAGGQARLQAKLVARVLGLKSTLLWARNTQRANALAAELNAAHLSVESVSLNELCARADLIVTTTPSTEPLLTASMIKPGARIVAVGADAPGKRELSDDLMARARVVVDSRAQCIDHGETSWAIRARLIDESALLEIGAVLSRPVTFQDNEIVVADLTGVAVQDVQIAKAVWSRIDRLQDLH
jgi:ornithine cyclodeaminase